MAYESSLTSKQYQSDEFSPVSMFFCSLLSTDKEVRNDGITWTKNVSGDELTDGGIEPAVLELSILLAESACLAPKVHTAISTLVAGDRVEATELGPVSACVPERTIKEVEYQEAQSPGTRTSCQFISQIQNC